MPLFPLLWVLAPALQVTPISFSAVREISTTRTWRLTWLGAVSCIVDELLRIRNVARGDLLDVGALSRRFDVALKDDRVVDRSGLDPVTGHQLVEGTLQIGRIRMHLDRAVDQDVVLLVEREQCRGAGRLADEIDDGRGLDLNVGDLRIGDEDVPRRPVEAKDDALAAGERDQLSVRGDDLRTGIDGCRRQRETERHHQRERADGARDESVMARRDHRPIAFPAAPRALAVAAPAAATPALGGADGAAAVSTACPPVNSTDDLFVPRTMSI